VAPRSRNRAVDANLADATSIAPQPRRWQLVASSILFGLWLLFLLAMAIAA
jgi:hypothetical protein